MPHSLISYSLASASSPAILSFFIVIVAGIALGFLINSGRIVGTICHVTPNLS
jgi:hypothetical protein